MPLEVEPPTIEEHLERESFKPPPVKKTLPPDHPFYVNQDEREDTKKKIILALKAGNTRLDSALWAGILSATFYTWLRADEAFAREVVMAEAHAKIAAVSAITAAARNGSYQAATIFLERRYPREWGKSDILNSALRNMTPDELKQFVLERIGITGPTALQPGPEESQSTDQTGDSGSPNDAGGRLVSDDDGEVGLFE